MHEHYDNLCHDLIIGLATKAKARKGVDQECNLGVTFAHLHSRECEGMNPHTPK